MTSLTVSQTFPGASAGFSITENTNGSLVGGALVSPAVDSATVSYNASTQSYTVTSGGFNTTFAPADKDAASSTNLVTAYTKKSGAVEDDLVLSVSGAGALTLSYTNLALWSRATTSATSTSVSQGVVVYGIPTAASDLPRTGSASYQTGMSGIWATPTDLRVLTGSSTLTADFAAGTTRATLNINGVSSINGLTTVLGGFAGTASINSANASFAGPMTSTSNSSAAYSGVYAGRFYGPAAAEVGAAFTLTNGAGGYIDGAILGKK